MTDAPQSELPPAAQARIARARTHHVRSSLLTIAGQAAAEDSGFEVVGEVMGAIVQRIGFAGYGGCGGYYGPWGRSPAPAQTLVSGQAGFSGYGPYVKALYRGYEVALRRMLIEAQGLGADGVVGVTWTEERLSGTDAREYLARGTAVRARSAARPVRLFSTDLSGAEVATIVQAGWFPASLVLGVAVAIRHDDYATRRAASWSTVNQEVPGYTELVTITRAQARHQFEQRSRRALGDSATVSDMRLHVWRYEPGENHYDHVAEATVVGNAIVRFHDSPAAPTRSLTVLPLRRLTP